MYKAKAIRPGCRVAFVAPASCSSSEKYAHAVELFESRGYEVSIGSCCQRPPTGHRWDDLQRAKELESAWFSDEVDAIICVRGGYGCARLLGHLNLDRMASNPKLFAGYSDITTLHIALNNRGLATLHSPMAATLKPNDPPWVADSFFDALEGKVPTVESDSRLQVMTAGVIEGRLAGGCLRLVCDSLATPDEIDTRGRVLILEDVDESPHRVDAMLTQLLNAGKLESCVGFVIGEMTGTDEKRNDSMPSPTWKEIVRERLGALEKPTIIGFPVGHRPENATLPLGAMARLDANRGILECLEAGVEPS